MELDVLILSRAGGRPVNEDAGGFWSSERACFCVLSDGAGGHGGGDVASKIAVREALRWFEETPECSLAAVHCALSAANQAIVREQGSRPQLDDMRATAVVLAIDTEHGIAAWGHLGDTRLYCFRRRQVVIRTRDHSVVQSMVDAGLVRPEDLPSLPGRSRLLGALGDLEHFDPAIAEQPITLQNGDCFLLCTDGLWEFVTEADMERDLMDAGSAREWLQALESRVRMRERPGQDNYSALAVWCTSVSDDTWPEDPNGTITTVAPGRTELESASGNRST